jgi:hypothetical protein
MREMDRERHQNRKVMTPSILFLLGVVGILGLLASGCGRKAMPIAPHRIPPPRVSDLKGRVQAGQVTLTWTVPADKVERAGLLLTAVVYRSKLPLKNGGCEHCPLRFEPVERLPVPAGAAPKMQYTQRVEPGFRYTYQVVLMGGHHMAGDPSNSFETIVNESDSILQNERRR